MGMVHLGPLLGYPNSPPIEEIINNAIQDARIFQDAGYDAILVENNYDLPHEIFVSSGTAVSMGKCIAELKKVVTIPIGVCVLWNDYKTALSLAKLYELQFIRIAVFVDHVRTDFGEIFPCSKQLNEYKKLVGADNVLIFTDIQVKHSTLLNLRPISESALEAIEQKSDGLIITGRWTGDAPVLDQIQSVRGAVKDFPILIGSGTDESNLSLLLKYANGIIVGTSVKTGETKDKTQERNLKPYSYRIDKQKAVSLQKKFAGCLSN